MKVYPLIGDIDALVPEWWAREALAYMEAKKVLLGRVNRDYDKYFAVAGETVNVHHELGFTAKRKFQGQSVVKQQPQATGDTVVLNQHLHVTIEIDDRDQQRAQQDLIAKYAPRGAEAMVSAMEQVITGEVYNFVAQSAGAVGITAANVDAGVMNLREFFQRENTGSSRLISVGAATDKLLQNVDRYISASEIQDSMAQGSIRNGLLGRLRGFDVYESSFTPEIPATQTTVDGAVDNGAGYIAGQTTLTVDGFVGALTNGSWCLIEGEMLPHRISTATGTPCTQIVITPALRAPVADDAVITVMEAGTVDHPDGVGESYAAQYGDVIQVTGFTDMPISGQGITFGNSNTGYMVTDVDEGDSTILLNRPLDEAVAHGATIALMPYGNYNLAIVPEAITFVNRPMATPQFSVRSGFAAADGLSLRVTFAYDANYMVTTVTFDTLCAVKTLDTRYGGVFVS